MAQDLDRPSTGASSSDTPDHSVHMRSRSTAHTQSPKRLSVFSGRSRSNTTTSTPSITSSRRSQVSSMASNENVPMPFAHEDRITPAAGVRHDRHESTTKSLFLRGSRILRRQGSKVTMVGPLDEEEDAERDKSRFDFSRRKSRSNDSHEHMKRMISDPFDFHHLTHTSPAQFEALGKTRENELVTEFSAIRASQKPVTNLKGIRAEDIQMRSLSTEDFCHCVPEDINEGPLPISPPRSPGARSTSPQVLEYRPLRESRVFENFSRPVPRYPRGDAASSPPRASSPRLASSPEIPEPSRRVIDEILDLDSRQQYPEHAYYADDDSAHDISPKSRNLEEMMRSSLGHAITTGVDNDNRETRTASALASPTSELEDVPEEDEATHWHDSPQSQQSEYPASLGSQVSPKAIVAPKSHLSIDVAKELSKKFTEALGSPTLPQYLADRAVMPVDEHRAQSSLRRQPSVHKTIHETIYESWDDDIDYCYEHAAESSSDFDWARTSFEESNRVAVTITASNPATSSAHHPVSSSNSRCLGTSDLSTPDLNSSCLQSAPSSRLAIAPSGNAYEGEKNGDFFQSVSSSMLSGALTKHIPQDALYEDYLATDGESDRHFSFYSQSGLQAIDQPVSPRSSFSPISKYNSQESLILSRAASIVRKHRSSVSTTSVPELVHSLASSRDFSSSDLMLPGEQSELVRNDSSRSSNHRQTKSLARELETQIMSRPDGNGSTDSTKLMGVYPHDRAKSTSEVEAAPLVSKAMRPELPSKSALRKKGRTTSYSLFPSPTLPSPANS
ncbi:uncharacterized protein DSM5745_10574 [Aspergillus mulundensis]|uniref:CRIB domain-containing protein n=1 Tax=Aspergillus mulundensis TaxID=1810919 RepID=A0A3D8QJA5_9EURO|nr:Uncharacterized protein DSM5745_10574 [Aspergillus mulundensis]RDW61902.1 Uncharacterized protein DSM5745_10574 [Aspergillus mulundensis]